MINDAEALNKKIGSMTAIVVSIKEPIIVIIVTLCNIRTAELDGRQFKQHHPSVCFVLQIAQLPGNDAKLLAGF